MFGNRYGGACGGAVAALLILSTTPTQGSATNDPVRADITGDEASSFAARSGDVRYGFYRFEPARTPANAAIGPCPWEAGMSTPDVGTDFSYVGRTPEAARPPDGHPAWAMTPVLASRSLVLLLAGTGLFVLRGTVVWRQDPRRSGDRA